MMMRSGKARTASDSECCCSIRKIRGGGIKKWQRPRNFGRDEKRFDHTVKEKGENMKTSEIRKMHFLRAISS